MRSRPGNSGTFMGRQVIFYMLPDDLLDFEKALRLRGSVRFLNYRQSQPELETIQTLAVPRMGETSVHACLVREADLSDVVVLPIPKQNYWVVDERYSPVVQ